MYKSEGGGGGGGGEAVIRLHACKRLCTAFLGISLTILSKKVF